MASSSPIARAVPLASIALLFMMMMSVAEAGRCVQIGNANYCIGRSQVRGRECKGGLKGV